MNVNYEKKEAMTFIGYHTEILPEEGYQKCPEFWDREYAAKYARLWQTMQPETDVEKAILDNRIGMFAICADAENGFEYWIAGLYRGGEDCGTFHVLCQGVVHGHEVVTDDSRNPGDVDFQGMPFPEGLSERGSGFPVFCEQHNAGGGEIQTVDRVCFGRDLFHSGGQGIPLPLSRNGKKPRGLDGDNNSVFPEENIRGALWGTVYER